MTAARSTRVTIVTSNTGTPEVTPRLSVVVPVFNEESSLEELATEIATVLDGAAIPFEVVFVDDGSTDKSWDVMCGIHGKDPRFGTVRFRRNYGKSAALAVGFRAARGLYVATVDADLQDNPAELPAMVALLDSGNDLVSGWKKKRNDPISKVIPSRFFNFVTRRISGIRLHDFNCGLKMYRAEVVKNVRVYGELHRYIPLLAKWEGYSRIAEHVVEHRPRKYGDTKFGLERFVRGFLDLLTVLFMTRFARRPMHFFGGMGTLAFIGGFMISLYLTYGKLVHGTPLFNRPLLLLGSLLILLGAQMFLTGLLGEMVARPRMEDPGTYEIIDEIHARMPADALPATAQGMP